MTLQRIVAGLVAGCLMAAPVAAQAQEGPAGWTPGWENGTTVQTGPTGPKYRSPWLAITGGLIAGTGAAVLLTSVGWPEGENWEINGRTYCYDTGPNRIDFERGACGESMPLFGPEVRPYAWGAVGAGALLMWLGLQKVEVRPMVGHGVKGASATVKW